MFEQIMEEICSGLTGDCKKDIAYLDEQCYKYKNHELNMEILRACNRLIFSMLPKDEIDEFSKKMEKELQRQEVILEEARFNVYRKNFEKSLELYEIVIQQIEDANLYEEDSQNIYFDFNELIEEFIYHEFYSPQKTVRNIDFAYSSIYLEYGALLLELKKYNEARKALSTAMRWNPISPAIKFEYAELFKIENSMEEFFEYTKEILKVVYNSNDLARCYRNLGYYFTEMNMFYEAVALFSMSLVFEPNNSNAYLEMQYIKDKSGIGTNDIDPDENIAICENYGIQIGVNEAILDILSEFAQLAIDNDDYPVAIYLLEIFYDITNDEKIISVIDELKERADNC